MGEKTKTAFGAVGVMIGIFVLIFAAMVVQNLINPKEPTEKDRAAFAASECWKSYERKSLSDSEKQGIAKICEGLDARAK